MDPTAKLFVGILRISPVQSKAGCVSACNEGALAQEARLWYRIEWSSAVKDASYHDIQNEYPFFGLKDHYALWPMNSSDSHQCEAHTRGMVGTMRWVQRLRAEPARW